MSSYNTALAKQLAKAAESTLNLALSVDPASQSKLSQLEGSVLEIHLTSLEYSLFFAAEDQKVVVLNHHNQPSVTLSGSPLAFVKLAISRDKQSLFNRKEITLAGDAVRAQQIQRLMSQINVDWEALLAEVIGDVPAHFLGTSIKQGMSWGKMLGSSLINDIEEFVKYELRLLPNKALALKQFGDIDNVRMASDRLEARIKKLAQQTDSSTENTKTDDD